MIICLCVQMSAEKELSRLNCLVDEVDEERKRLQAQLDKQMAKSSSDVRKKSLFLCLSASLSLTLSVFFPITVT